MSDIVTFAEQQRERRESRNIVAAVRCAKIIRAGDRAVFDPESSIFEVWTTRGSEKIVLLAVKCSWIKTPNHFRDLSQLMGLNAEPQRRCTIPDSSVPEPLWAYRYL